MSLLQKLYARAQEVARAFHLAPDITAEIVDQSVDRGAKDLLGGWLFNLTKEAACQHYENTGTPFSENPETDVEPRIESFAAVLAQPGTDATEIARRAEAIRDQRIEGAYFARVVTNVRNDYFTSRNQEYRLFINADENKIGVSGTWRRDADPRLPHPAVIQARWRVAFHPTDNLAEETLAYAHGRLLNRRPQDIVNDFARIPLAQLSLGMTRRFIADGLSEPRVRQDCPGLFAIQAAKPVQTFSDLWDPAALVKEWSESDKAGPNRDVCRLYIRKLGYEPWRLLAERGEQPLGKLAEFAEGQHRGIPSVTMDAAAAATPLSDYCKPPRTVSDWIAKVQRRLDAAARRDVGIGLQAIFDHLGKGLQGHQILVFLMVHCMGRTGTSVAESEGEKSLGKIKETVTAIFQASWDAEPQTAGDWFKRLHNALQLDRDRKLKDCAPNGDPLRAEHVLQWSTDVYRAVSPQFKTGALAPLFAHYHDLLDGPRH